MGEIPHDIREAAAKALNEAEAMIGTLFSDRLDVVAKAILAERRHTLQAAAQIAIEMAKPDDELWATDLGSTPETKIAGARAYIAGQIASAIQSLVTPKAKGGAE